MFVLYKKTYWYVYDPQIQLRLCVFFIYTCHEHFHVLKLFEKVSGFFKNFIYLFCNPILFPKQDLKDSDTFTVKYRLSKVVL